MGDLFHGETCVPNDPTASHPDVKKAFMNIRINNINKLIFGHLNKNALRNNFDHLSELVRAQ